MFSLQRILRLFTSSTSFNNQQTDSSRNNLQRDINVLQEKFNLLHEKIDADEKEIQLWSSLSPVTSYSLDYKLFHFVTHASTFVLTQTEEPDVFKDGIENILKINQYFYRDLLDSCLLDISEKNSLVLWKNEYGVEIRDKRAKLLAAFIIRNVEKQLSEIQGSLYIIPERDDQIKIIQECLLVFLLLHDNNTLSSWMPVNPKIIQQNIVPYIL